MRPVEFSTLLLAFAGMVGCAHGKRLDLLEAEVVELRAEVDAHRARLDAADAERAEARVATAEGSAALLLLDEAVGVDRGRLDDLTKLVVRERDRHRVADETAESWRAWVDARVATLERRSGVERTQAPWDESDDDTAAFVAADIREARGHLDDDRPAHAREVALHSLKQYGGHPDAVELRMIVGDAWAAEQRWTRAAESYHALVEAHPETALAPAARLKMADAFEALGDAATARVVLEDVLRLHPDSAEAATARARLGTDTPPGG